jgi:2-iminobutanoate/2-iminopropanoate deaminase
MKPSERHNLISQGITHPKLHDAVRLFQQPAVLWKLQYSDLISVISADGVVKSPLVPFSAKGHRSMANGVANPLGLAIDLDHITEGERCELLELGILNDSGGLLEYVRPVAPVLPGAAIIEKRAVRAPEVLNEAYNYAKPSSFSRGLRVDITGATVLFISGTASIDEFGKTVHVGDFGAQCWRTYRNITSLLKSEGATWHDVVRATCYLRDIERDYEQFNKIRTAFFRWLGLNPLPASVGVQARLCREQLLIEIEAIAIIPASAPRVHREIP